LEKFASNNTVLGGGSIPAYKLFCGKSLKDRAENEDREKRVLGDRRRK
jgi:hypothetical protein